MASTAPQGSERERYEGNWVVVRNPNGKSPLVRNEVHPEFHAALRERKLRCSSRPILPHDILGSDRTRSVSSKSRSIPGKVGVRQIPGTAGPLNLGGTGKIRQIMSGGVDAPTTHSMKKPVARQNSLTCFGRLRLQGVATSMWPKGRCNHSTSRAPTHCPHALFWRVTARCFDSGSRLKSQHRSSVGNRARTPRCSFSCPAAVATTLLRTRSPVLSCGPIRTPLLHWAGVGWPMHSPLHQRRGIEKRRSHGGSYQTSRCTVR